MAMEGKTSSRVAMGLMCGLAICCAVMYVTADGEDSVTESVLASKGVHGIGGPASVDSTDVQKVGTVITNTPDGRMRLTDYLTNVEKEIAAEEAARKRDVEAVRAQMDRNFAFNKAARIKLNKALLKKMARNAKTAKNNLHHAMRWVQGKFARAKAINNRRHKAQNAEAEAERVQINADQRQAKKQLQLAVTAQQRAMSSLKAKMNARIKSTDTAVAKNAAQIVSNAKAAQKDLDHAVGEFDTKVAKAAAGAAAGRSKLNAQLVSQDKAARAAANNKLKLVIAETAAQFQETRRKMTEERHRVDLALKHATTRMDASLKAQSALENEHFQKSVSDIKEAKREAEKAVEAAAVDFKLGLSTLAATVTRQVTQTNNRIADTEGVVTRNKVAQAQVNSNVAAETKRMVKLGKARYDEHIKKDKELKKLIDSNKEATDARMNQMSAHYLMELDAVRATMKKNRAHATKMLSKESAKLYAAISKSEAAQHKTNGELKTQTREAGMAIHRELNEAKADFTKRIGALSKTVVGNQKKFQGKFNKLTGIVREEAIKSAKGRKDLSKIMEKNKKDLESDVSDAIKHGEDTMKKVETKLTKQNTATQAALKLKISAEISAYSREAHSQIEGLRLNSKKAREEMRAELLTAVRSMAKEAKDNLAKETEKAAAAFVKMNGVEDAAADTSAKGRAALGASILEEKKAAETALFNTVATLQKSLLALKTETKTKIAKTNTRVDAYAVALTKEAEEVDLLMKNQMTNLLGGIADQRKAASNAITTADAASLAGFKRGMEQVETALEKAQKASSKKFGEMTVAMGKQRAAIDKDLAERTKVMNDSIAKAAALADERFSKTVDDISAARKDAAKEVKDARKAFATSLDAITSKIKFMETKLVGDVAVVSGVVLTHRAQQNIVNNKNTAEQKRINKLMNDRHSESIKARGELRRVLDENKKAAAEETNELDKLFKNKIGKIRAQMAKNSRSAAKDLTEATAIMYGEMATAQAANLRENAAHTGAINKYATESAAAIKASRDDFSQRIKSLTGVVAANHEKNEKGLTVLSGVIRDEKKASATDRALIRQQNKAMGDDMSKKIVEAVQLGEAKARIVASEARQNLDTTSQAMLVKITDTVEHYADMAFKTISGDHQKIADNYLSLKAYAVTGSAKLGDYTAKGKGKNLSSLGDLLTSIAALSDVKPQPAEGLSASSSLSTPFSGSKVKVDNKVTKINYMVNEFVSSCNQVRMRWPMGLGKYLLLKLQSSMSGKGVLQVDKIDEKSGNFVFLNGHSVGLSNKLNDFEDLAVSMGAYEKTLAKLTSELSGSVKKVLAKRAMATPPEWDGK